MALLKWLLVVVAIYGGALALVYFGQRSLQYHPDKSRVPPAVAGLPSAEEIQLTTTDGETVIVWHVPPKGDKPVVRLVAIPQGQFKLGVLEPEALGAGPDFFAPMDEDELADWEGRS